MGRHITEEHRQALILANTGRIRTEAQNEAVRVANKDKVRTEAHREIVRQTQLNRQKHECVWCGKSMNEYLLNRWHNDNCYNNPNKIKE